MNFTNPIAPSVGRVVLVHSGLVHEMGANAGQFVPALITGLGEGNAVHLMVQSCGSYAAPQGRLNVAYGEPNGPDDEAGSLHWCWMPYQKSVAGIAPEVAAPLKPYLGEVLPAEFAEVDEPANRIWGCKIGYAGKIPAGSDVPMRRAVEAAFRALTGRDASFTFSGWGETLTDDEREVVAAQLPPLGGHVFEGLADDPSIVREAASAGQAASGDPGAGALSYSDMSAGDMLAACGSDASKWADAFHERFPQVAADDALGWFANAIENSWDVRLSAITHDDTRLADHFSHMIRNRDRWRELADKKVKLSDLKPGDVLVADGGFTCMDAGPTTVVDANGTLAVPCREGTHALDGQEDEDGTLAGFKRPSA